ncbi:hypothetical protein BBI01_05925 [Chryseobacterium artocarpi]|uniref:Uncharacterized protein n=1 Tax=Chryseobacterium artocarpi TaxID=1414727 RepID=A0A1B8ZX97_9FLAO|nr:hypothetical protein [Chryseobacterium artocarpi]OCA76228.1 hypothetical protein BBI01_05925 [Chryseobacterium artocarpi]
MKKLIYTFLILSSATLFSQKKLAVVGDIIGTTELFDTQKKTMYFSKTYTSAASLPTHLRKFSSAFPNGVTEYKNKNYVSGMDKLTFEQINRQYNIPENNTVFLDGHEFTDTQTTIFAEIAAKIEVKDYNGKKTLYISTSN